MGKTRVGILKNENNFLKLLPFTRMRSYAK
jgi:hypothetical protein